MNNETYQALKEIIKVIKSGKNESFEKQGENIACIPDKIINQVEGWVDEVKKEYEEDIDDRDDDNEYPYGEK